ncbi:MAG: PAS domain S-box protein [Deltaproteobacteria bacterium]|nr:PAS domain S-box protein [Deltaproteobacteria bacterium]
MIRIAIVGAGHEGAALLQLWYGKEGIEIAGMADRDPQAPGLQLACHLGVPTTLDVRELLKDSRPQLLIDVAGDPSVAVALKSLVPLATEIPLGNTACLWSLIQDPTYLSAIVQESVDAIFTLDPQDRIIFWNRGAELLLGYRAEEILGQPFFRLIPPERHDEIKKIRALLEQQGFVRDYESERLAKDGTRIPFNITVTELRDEKGQRVNLTGILRDIRESKKLAMEREARYKELKILHEISQIILNSPNLNTVLEGILDKALAVGSFDLGVIHLIDSGDDVLRPMAHRGYRDPENVKRHYKDTKDPATGRLVARVINYKEVRIEENVPESDGLRTFKREGIHSAMVVPVRAQEDVFGVLQLGSRTPRKFPPTEVHLLEAIGSQLGIAVQKARLYEEARQAYEKLKSTHERLIQGERLRALGELASGVAHDFNNLLTTILGRTEMLLKKIKDPDVRNSLEVIQKATLDGASTVHRVQEFARVKNEEPHTTCVDLVAVIADAIEFTRSRWEKEAQAAGVSITIRNECTELPSVLGSPSQLREIFTNLILNAVDAMPQGGTITFRSQTIEDGVLLEISDTGIGIPPETQKCIFQPFFTTKDRKGTGLGLSIVEGIVQRHQGNIWVKSQEGEGTTFTIELPLATPVADQKILAAPCVTSHSGNILVIDDDGQVREILCDILELAGHKPQGAASGAQGLALLREGGYDLVLTDLKMPEMDGWEVARAVKAHHPDIPVVLISAWGMELTGKQIRENGIAAVITKPFRSLEITDTVSHLLTEQKRTIPRED